MKGRKGSHGGHGGHGRAEGVLKCLWMLLLIIKGIGLLCTFILPAVATLHVGPVPKQG